MGQKVDVKGLHEHFGGVVSEWTLRQKAKAGLIPGAVKLGKYIFDLDVIDEWFREGQAKTGGPQQPGKISM